MNTIHLPLVWLLERLKWPSRGRSSCEGFYFPYGTLWMRRHVILVPLKAFMLILVAIPEPARIPLLHVFLQFPFSYRLFYLLLQVLTILYVMSMIFMKMVVFPLIAHTGWRVQWSGPFEIVSVLNFHQNLVDRHHQRCALHQTGVFVISLSTPFDILMVCSVPFLSSSVVFFFFLLLLGFLYPFYGC